MHLNKLVQYQTQSVSCFIEQSVLSLLYQIKLHTQDSTCDLAPSLGVSTKQFDLARLSTNANCLRQSPIANRQLPPHSPHVQVPLLQVAAHALQVLMRASLGDADGGAHFHFTQLLQRTGALRRKRSNPASDPNTPGSLTTELKSVRIGESVEMVHIILGTIHGLTNLTLKTDIYTSNFL